jgi:N-acetylglucosaminyldiphosphoundecaprenol N-acetyl-beta-D-mannosaminyltransferase
MDSQEPLNRISVLGVSVDILPEESIEGLIDRFADGKNHQIVLLSLWDLMRARRSGEFRTMIEGASLVLPISLSIVKGARFLHRTEPVRYMPFDFVVKFLAALEQRGKSVYLLGGSRTSIQKAEGNVKSTFPGLRVVGRYAGRYPKLVEGAIIEAVKKATPTLLLVGKGVPGRERWIPRNLAHFNSGVYLWCSDLFEVFAERRAKPSRSLFRKGLEWLPSSLLRPWKWYRALIYLWYCISLIIARFRRE